MYYYSPSENIFIPELLKQDYIEAGTFPDDSIEVDDVVWLEFAGNPPPKGKQCVAGKDGRPVWGDVSPPSYEQLVADAEVQKTIRMQAITDAIAPLQDAVDLDIATEQEQQKLVAWKKYRVLLNRVDTSKAPDIEWPKAPD